MNQVTIRKGIQTDIPQVFDLINELAAFENSPGEVENTIEQLELEGFGPDPLYGLIVAELDNRLIGMSLYYFRYSTWKGKRLYIEDIIVNESFRGKGIGSMLFEASIDAARETRCNGMTWLVLDWNTQAKKFYDRYNASYDPSWEIGSLTGDQVRFFERNAL